MSQDDAGLVTLSADFALYGDMSDRITSMATVLGPVQENYSIDESFIDLTGVRGDLVERSHKIRDHILQWVGIPCWVGIGITKTLAKLANYIAKTAERKPGSYTSHFVQVCNLTALSPAELRETFAATAVGEVWGIGRRISKQLEEGGIRTVQDLIELDSATVRRGQSVVLERTVRDLQGTPCIDLDDSPAAKKEIAYTRFFGLPVLELHELREAVTEFASRAAEKMRKQHCQASQALVFFRTSPFPPEAHYSRSLVVSLRRPSADTTLIVMGALTGLDAIFRAGFK